MKKILISIAVLISFSASAQRMLVLPDTPRFANQNKGIWVLRIADNLPYYSNGIRWVLADAGSISPQTINDSLNAYNSRNVTAFNNKRGNVFGVDSVWFNGTGDSIKWRYNNVIYSHVITAIGGTGGTDNTNTNSYYRLLVPSTQAVKTLMNDYGVKIDSISYPGSITISLDSSNVFNQMRAWVNAQGFSTSGGTNNSNAGSGYRIVIPSSQAIKTLFNAYGLAFDSTTNTNALTFKLDSATVYSFIKNLIKDTNTLNTFQKVTDRGNTTTNNLQIDKPRGSFYISGNPSVSSFSYEDTTSGASFSMTTTAALTELYIHDNTATDAVLKVNNVRAELNMGTPDDQLRTRLVSDTNKVSLQQINGGIRGGGSLKINFPKTQDIWSNNYVQEVQPKSGTLALTSNINDSLNANATNFYNAGTGTDSIAYINGDTIKLKRPVAGWGGKVTTTLTTNIYGSDSAVVASRARAQKMVDDSSSVLRALISTISPIDTVWQYNKNANHKSLDSLNKFSVYRQTGTSGTPTYALYNSSDKEAHIVLSNSDKTATGNGGYLSMVRATLPLTGNIYWETTINGTGNHKVGISKLSESLSSTLGDGADSYGYQADGQKKGAGTNASYGASYAATDVISTAYNATSGTLEFFKNGVSQGVSYTGLTGTFYPAHSFGASAVSATVNFGQSAFVYTPPSGYTGLYTGGGGYTYAPVISTDTSGHVFIGPIQGTAGLNINRSISINPDSITANATYVDTVLKINNATWRLEKYLVKHFGNSDLSLTGNRIITQSSYSLIFSGSGNVGFGTVTSPSFKIHLKDAFASNYGMLIENTSSNSSAFGVIAFYNDNGSSSRAGIIKNSNSNTSYAGINSLNILQNTTEPIGFVTNNLLRAIITGAGNMGVNVAAPTSTLDIGGSITHSYTTKTSNYTATASDYTIFCNGAITISLPAAAGCAGRVYVIKNISASNVVIDPNASETIDGVTTRTISLQWESVIIQSDGSNWYVIN